MGLPFHLILLASMAVSLVWGVAIFIMGISTLTNAPGLLDHTLDDFQPLIKDVEPALQNAKKELLIPYSTTIPDDLDLGLSLMGAMMIIAGAAVIAFSAFGLFAAMKRLPVLLFGLIATIAIAIVIEILLLYLMGGTDTNLHTAAKDHLATEVKSQYIIETKRSFDKVLNSLMMTHHCCGIKGPEDFRNLTYLEPADQEVLRFAIPPACCYLREMATTALPARAYLEILECAKTPLETNTFIYKKGCYDKLFNKVVEEHGSKFMLTIGLIIGWQLIQIICAILVALTPVAPEEVAAVKEVGGKPVVHRPGAPGAAAPGGVEEEVKKQFIPFSKVSSFISSDVNRIKSTEIW